jgi:replicative DNA helicase
VTRTTYHTAPEPSTVLIDEQAERDLLGCMILAPLSPIRDVTEDLFGTPNHREIAAAILHLVEQSVAVDYLEVIQELRRRGKNPNAAYISDLCQGVVIARPISRRIDYLRELSHRRKLAAIAESLAERAPNLADPLPAIIATLLESVPNV